MITRNKLSLNYPQYSLLSGALFIILPVVSIWMTVEKWLDDLRFFALFNSISIISERWADENAKAMLNPISLQATRFETEYYY